MLATATPAAAEPSADALMVVRALAYDARLQASPSKTLHVTVILPKGSASPLHQDMDAVARRYSVAGRPLIAHRHDWVDVQALDRALAQAKPGAIYVGPGLSAHAAQIAERSRWHQLLSFAAVEADLKAGLAIAFVQRGARLVPVINIIHAMAEGAQLEAPLLSLAEIRK